MGVPLSPANTFSCGTEELTSSSEAHQEWGPCCHSCRNQPHTPCLPLQQHQPPTSMHLAAPPDSQLTQTSRPGSWPLSGHGTPEHGPIGPQRQPKKSLPHTHMQPGTKKQDTQVAHSSQQQQDAQQAQPTGASQVGHGHRPAARGRRGAHYATASQTSPVPAKSPGPVVVKSSGPVVVKSSGPVVIAISSDEEDEGQEPAAAQDRPQGPASRSGRPLRRPSGQPLTDAEALQVSS